MHKLYHSFASWYNTNRFAEHGSVRNALTNLCQVQPTDGTWKEYWMYQSYCAGASALWQQVNSALVEFAERAEHLDPEFISPSEQFDCARENLHNRFYNQQLELFDAR
jgi:hypothetical protein